MAKSKTLTYKDTITRTGYTEIDGVKVMRHTCTISADNPENMQVSSTRIATGEARALYEAKANRDICRADAAEFEEAAYGLQSQYTKEGTA